MTTSRDDLIEANSTPVNAGSTNSSRRSSLDSTSLPGSKRDSVIDKRRLSSESLALSELTDSEPPTRKASPERLTPIQGSGELKGIQALASIGGGKHNGRTMSLFVASPHKATQQAQRKSCISATPAKKLRSSGSSFSDDDSSLAGTSAAPSGSATPRAATRSVTPITDKPDALAELVKESEKKPGAPRKSRGSACSHGSNVSGSTVASGHSTEGYQSYVDDQFDYIHQKFLEREGGTASAQPNPPATRPGTGTPTALVQGMFFSLASVSEEAGKPSNRTPKAGV